MLRREVLITFNTARCYGALSCWKKRKTRFQMPHEYQESASVSKRLRDSTPRWFWPVVRRTFNYPVWNHCCKLPKCDFCISQGSATTVLRWGWQNRSHLSQVSSWCCAPKIIEIGQCFTDLFEKITLAQFFETLCIIHRLQAVITRSHGSVSVVRTTVKVNGKWQNLTLSRR